ncbi:hypothetical protein CSPAE12_11390 [Colletotrichum incanum]|nr:hypothetical protein CSPAE12_11390 [Colletotrichum incanum]
MAVVCSTGDPCGIAALRAQLGSLDLQLKAVQALPGSRPFCGSGEQQTIGHELHCSDSALDVWLLHALQPNCCLFCMSAN